MNSAVKQLIEMAAETNSIVDVITSSAHGLMDSCSSSSENEDADIEVDFMDEVNRWSERTYKSHFRLERNTVDYLIGAIGSIDGSHITINAPKHNKESYFNRKQGYSIVLQGVVDSEKKFINLHCGEPGSLHDSRVLRRSELYKEAQNNTALLFPGSTYLLGDSAYGANSWLVPPFKNTGQLSTTHHRFNNIHSAARIGVENAFADLKGRFRRIFKYTEHRNICRIKEIVVSACVLHNICIMQTDYWDEESEENEELEGTEESEEHEVQDESPRNRRDTLFSYMSQQNML